MLNFVAIDFETANASRDSACALGVVMVREGKIMDRRYSLIKPKGEFQKFCTYIHGITEEDVVHAPEFSDIYPAVFSMLNDQIVIAHNASFDIAVLKASCESRHLPFPNIESFCTVDMARKAWPDLPKHKLNVLCEEFGLPLNHHNAIEDATACSLLLLRCAKENRASSIPELRALLRKKADDMSKKKRAVKPKAVAGGESGGAKQQKQNA